MKDTSVKYLGLDLRNPIIISSSGLTASADKVKQLADAGAGAVVLKSVFEEQIVHQTTHLEGYNAYPEAADYLSIYLKDDYLATYIKLIEESKKNTNIPIIASINCLSEDGSWATFAERIASAGADALELNIFTLPTSSDQHGCDIEARNLRIIGKVTAAVNIPVAVKISSHFTNPLEMLKGIVNQNARGAVMFNRFYEPDINIDSMVLTEGDIFSTSADMRDKIRWVAMGSAEFPHLDISYSGGVQNSKDAIKMLLCGAKTVQLCSTVYKHGLGVIGEINRGIEKWMEDHMFESTTDLIGLMNYKSVSNPLAFERSQFMKYFASRT